LPLLFRLVRNGIIPPLGKSKRQSGISDQTRLEMEAGTKAVAKAAALKSKAGARVNQNKTAK